MAGLYDIRAVESEDYEVLAALLRDNYRDPETGLSLEEDLVEARAAALMKASLSGDISHKVFLAVVNGEAVGVSYVIADEKRGGFLVDELYTQKEYEGHGIGSALLRACEEFVIGQHSNDIHLSVEISNIHARDFYEKRGWLRQNFQVSAEDAISGTTTDIDPLVTVPTYLLKKEL